MALGVSKKEFQQLDEFPKLTQEIVKLAGTFVQRVQANLDAMGKISTGAISDGIAVGEVEQDGSSLKISVGYPEGAPASVYWDFVNKGVRGAESGQPSQSPYAFKESKSKGSKNPLAKFSPPPVMVEAIYGWMQTNRIAARKETQTRNLSSLQRKRARITQISQDSANRDLAYLIARSIKRRGLPYTGYVDKAVEETFGPDAIAKVAEALGVDVTVAITEANTSPRP